MARQGINRLSARTVATARKAGLYADGGGLYLQVSRSGGRSWLFRFMLHGKAREMGLGSLATVGLPEAREAAAEARKLCAAGVDPIEHRREERARARLGAAQTVTFREAAEAYIAAHRKGWRNGKHASQWETSLETYAYPVIGDQPVQLIDTALVLKVIEPLWSSKNETASRVRGRIEAILDREIALGHREEPNPARWRGNMKEVLPARRKVHRVRHHEALPYPEIGVFMVALRQRTSISAAALEFAILTAARSGEVRGARWAEIDMDARVWIVPADRIKSGREHRVPLSDAALAVLKRMLPLRRADDFVFPGGREAEPLSDMALKRVLVHLDRPELTPHGFRSTFRDWSAERTAYPAEVAEMALAHVVGDETERAYRRGDLFDKRRRLMDAWAEACATVRPAGEVVALAS